MGELRQAAGNDHQTGRPQRHRLVDGTVVIVAHRLAHGRVGRKQAAAAIAGKPKAAIAQRLGSPLQANRRNLFAPRRDLRDAVALRCLQDGQEIGLRAHGPGIEREVFEIAVG